LQMCIAASEGLSLQRKELPNFTSPLSHCFIELVFCPLNVAFIFNCMVHI
jgi:hypothetical protein